MVKSGASCSLSLDPLLPKVLMRDRKDSTFLHEYFSIKYLRSEEFRTCGE